MFEKLLMHLRQLEAEEHFFGADFLEAIGWAEAADAYLLRVYDFEPLFLKKDGGFASTLFTVIHYLTEKKSQHVNGPKPDTVSNYYRDWLLFKQCYLIRKAWFYLNIDNENDVDEVTELLIHILGVINYKTVTQIFDTSNEDYLGHGSIAMNYVGNTRAVRDLSMKYLDPKVGTQWQFHLWHLTPTTITDTYGYVFYLGNELSKIDYCPYDYEPKEYYYHNLYTTIYGNLEKDIPKNSHITAKQKKQIWRKISEQILHRPLKEESQTTDSPSSDNLTFEFDEDFDEECWFETDDE